MVDWRWLVRKIKCWIRRKGVEFVCSFIDEFKEDLKDLAVKKCEEFGECHSSIHKQLVREVVDVVLDEIKEEVRKRLEKGVC